MPNAIKYNTSAETLALKKGNFYIGTGDVGKGPTSSTGYYNGITPPSGGYTIYLNKETSGPSIYTVTTEAQMVSLTNTIGAQSFTTSGQCLNWFATQTDKMIFNRDYEPIVTNGLVLNLDAGFTPSYSRSGTTWYDVSGSNNGTLTNGPTFNSGDGGGSMSFDGVDDLITVPLIYSITSGQSISYEVWVYPKGQDGEIINKGTSDAGSFPDNPRIFLRSNGSIYWDWSYPGRDVYMNFSTINCTVNQWNQVVGVAIAGGSLKVYINGSDASGSVSGGNLPNPLPTTTNDLQIGGVTWVPRYNNASIAIVRVYQKELTALEVLQNYNAQKGRFGL
jgi:hypothetical protein